MVDDQPAQLVLEPYIAAARDGAGALPLLVPSPADLTALLDVVDGILLPGSPSNVAPHHYGGPPAREPVNEDPARDAASLALIRMAIAAGVPLLAICRGHQELNVALGGTLYQQVQEVPGRMDHRERQNVPVAVQYGPSHPVTPVQGGMLAALTGDAPFMVNSLHGQGIDTLAPGLRAEAHAPDGQIEAVSLRDAKGFVLGLQWHPEWQWDRCETTRVIWQAFGKALMR